MATGPDTVELATFREQWKAEVKSRKKALDVPASASGSSVQQPSVPPAVLAATQKYLNIKHLSAPADPAPPGKVHLNTNVPSQNLQSALKVYRDAIQREQNGELDDAIVLYRQAFRMDPHVDGAYAREEKLTIALTPLPQSKKDSTAVQVTQISSKPVSNGEGKHVTMAGILAQIISGFPFDVKFEPEDEKQPLWLRSLPDELLVFVLRRLDVMSIERFAVVSRKARLLSLDATLWRELVITTYKLPQIAQRDELATLMDRYAFNYRRMFVEHPRIRLDGVYIATCHYVRPGLSENHWVNISHLITYHRRFFPNGAVLSLLSNEEMAPQQVIPLLKPTLRMKGLYLGTWELLDTIVHLTLTDANERLPEVLPPSFLPVLSAFERFEGPEHSHRQHAYHTHGSSVNQPRTRYMFVMKLGLRSRPLGRWNRLNIESYDSVHLESGDISPVALKHERPFWFSKVRSFVM